MCSSIELFKKNAEISPRIFVKSYREELGVSCCLQLRLTVATLMDIEVSSTWFLCTHQLLSLIPSFSSLLYIQLSHSIRYILLSFHKPYHALLEYICICYILIWSALFPLIFVVLSFAPLLSKVICIRT